MPFLAASPLYSAGPQPFICVIPKALIMLCLCSYSQSLLIDCKQLESEVHLGFPSSPLQCLEHALYVVNTLVRPCGLCRIRNSVKFAQRTREGKRHAPGCRGRSVAGRLGSGAEGALRNHSPSSFQVAWSAQVCFSLCL